MPCFTPLRAFRQAGGGVVFREVGDVLYGLDVPCGRCIGCRLERSRQWAVRCVHEAKFHTDNCFITLTYDDAHLPVNNSLEYKDFQLFMRRLRKRFGKVRFFMAGEYGELFDRPHFHAILFGIDFPDRKFFTSSGEFDVYTSEILSELWPKGYSSVADFSFETAAYVARYCTKKVTGDLASSHYAVVNTDTGELFYRTPEFSRCSVKPGIGYQWFEKYYLSDVKVRDGILINGVTASPPRYYDKLLKRFHGYLALDDVKTKRTLDSLPNMRNNTYTRLLVRHEVKLAQFQFLKRKIL